MVENLHSPLGLVAGNGNFPLAFVKAARDMGLDVVAAAVQGEASPEIADITKKCTWIRFGQVGGALRALKESGAKQVVFLGGVSKSSMFSGLRLDLRGLLTIFRARSLHDDALLRALAQEVERQGMEVISAAGVLQECVVRAGALTRRKLSGKERADAVFGWDAALAVGRFEIGQGVVVHRRVVIAVEAVEGTDAMLKRAGQLTSGKGGVLVKLAKPNQDVRLDLPAVGVQTIERMKESGITALVLQEERALVLDPVEVADLADKAGIAISVYRSRDELDVSS